MVVRKKRAASRNKGTLDRLLFKAMRIQEKRALRQPQVGERPMEDDELLVCRAVSAVIYETRGRERRRIQFSVFERRRVTMFERDWEQLPVKSFH